MIQLDELRRDLGGRTLFSSVSCRIGEGDRIGLVGANGTGKTTLLRMLAGQEQPDEGRIDKQKDLIIGYLPQEVASLGEKPILDVVLEGAAETSGILSELGALESRLAADDPTLGVVELTRIATLHQRLDSLGGYDVESRARRILSGLGFKDEQCAHPASTFSGGWMMRVALARILLAAPDLLLLDEPTNHLDLPSLVWLEGYLDEFRGAMLVVSHDQTFLNRLATTIFELAQGRLTRYAGNYSKYVVEREVRREHQMRAHAQQQRFITEQEEFIARFRAKASKASQVQSRVKMLDKLERIVAPTAERRLQKFRFPEPPRTGHMVCSLKELSVGYGSHVVLTGVNLEIERGDRVALVGRNGEGKSTLSKVIAGEMKALGGELVLGHRVTSAYFGQHQIAELNLKQNVLDSAAEKNAERNTGLVRSALGAFLFTNDDMQKEVGVLSGGEKNRLALARILLAPAPLLVLDEPTNHLDIDSRAALEEALVTYAGTIVLVSHDRTFLNRLATVVLEVADGKVSSYKGNYDDYVYQRERRAEGLATDRATQQRAVATATTPTAAPQAKPPAPKPGAPKPSVSKAGAPSSGRDRRKSAQERRETLKPLTHDAKKHEAIVADLEGKLLIIDNKLSDPEFYNGPVGGEAFRERADLARKLELAMERWMEAQAKVEAAERALEQ